MRIKRIKVENFRSLKCIDIDVNGFNVFVGQNNAGKTNLFEAIEWFYKGVKKGIDVNSLKHSKDPSNEIKVEILFQGVQSGLELMKNEKNQKSLSNQLGELSEVWISKSSVDNKRKFVIDDEYIKPVTGFEAALNDFLPKFEYIHTKQYHDELLKYKKGTPIAVMLSDVLGEILNENAVYKNFKEKFEELFESENSVIANEFNKIGENVKSYLKEQFPDATKVAFEVDLPVMEDLLKKFETQIDDGVETTAEEKGDGMQRALMLAIIQTYTDYRREGGEKVKSFSFFIDEAELHLHPSAQRKLKNILLELSKASDQVFINTHSSVLIADNSNAQSIFSVEKEDGITGIEHVDDNKKQYVVYDLLGGTPADLLFPLNFIVVEGMSEVELLSRVVSRFYSDKPNIQIVAANGDIDQAERSINAIEKVYVALNNKIYGEKLVILIDKPSTEKEGGVKHFLRQNKQLKDRFIILEERSLEQSYPTQWKKTEAEEKKMSGKQKKNLAKNVGEKITKEDFEKNLKKFYLALEKAWELS